MVFDVVIQNSLLSTGCYGKDKEQEKKTDNNTGYKK